MTTNPEEHDFIKKVCAEDDAARVPPRLSDDPAVRLAECRGYSATTAVASSTADRFVASQGPAFDEAAERVIFEAWYDNERKKSAPYSTINMREKCAEAWLACAKSRAEGSV